MKTIIIANVHKGGQGTYTSRDYKGYKEFNESNEAFKFIQNNKLDIKNKYYDEKCGIVLIYITYFYDKNLAKINKLFEEGESEYENIYWTKEDEIENLKRKEQGYVVCGELTDYKGNLQKTLTQNLLSKLNYGYLGGYLGHSFRQLEHDIIIEKIFNNVTVLIDNVEFNKWEILSYWVTSVDGRHWMDLVDGCNNDDFEQKFIEHISDLVKSAFICALPEHNGTYASTIELLKKYKNRIRVKFRSNI
jgi:hypothetical protein